MAKKASRRTKTAKPAKKRPTTSRRGPKGKKPPPRTPREPRWLEQLRKRKQPLALQLDDGGRILPAEYHFNSSFDFGVVAQHPEGDIDYGVNRPTWRAFLGIDVPGFRRWSYAKQQAWVTEQYADRYACDDASPPWSGGQPGMNQWLDQTAETDDPEAGISEWTSEFFCGPPDLQPHDAKGAKRAGRRAV